MISRRLALRITAAAFIAGCAPQKADSPTSAQTDAAGGDTELGKLIRGADFASAAALFRGVVDQSPLNRDSRLILGKLHFAGRNFDAAVREFETIERRGGTKDDFRVIDIEELVGMGFAGSDSFVQGSRLKDSAAWLYLATLRQGRATSLPAGPRESIRSLLREETTIDEYVRIQREFMDEVLTQFGRDYAQLSGVGDVVTTGKKNLRAELTCVARFALAEQALGTGDASAARRNLEAALATRAERIIEFHTAKAELARLG
jgi:hypothetical protein